MASLKLTNVNKVYSNNVCAVHAFSLDVNDGEFVVIVGPSGCGKSTSLRMIAGLEDISSGKLVIDNKDVTKEAAKNRDIAMVFQNYALYAHMTVYENMAFSLKLRNEKEGIIHKKVIAASKILGLEKELNKKPKALSGGQRQRVAIGRAIVRNPKVFLFDEPLSNLDAKLRNSMRRELLLLQKKLKATIIYVTHDQTEALTLADKIVCMNNGYIMQVGSPLELYDRPANLFVAGFIGIPPMNLLDCFYDGNVLKYDNFEIKLEDFQKERLKDYINKNIKLGIRAEDILLGNDIETTVINNENIGQHTLVHVLLNKKKIICKFKTWCNYNLGDCIKISFNTKKFHFFDIDTEKRID